MNELLREKFRVMYLTGGTGIIEKKGNKTETIRSSTLRFSPDGKTITAETERGEKITLSSRDITDAHPS